MAHLEIDLNQPSPLPSSPTSAWRRVVRVATADSWLAALVLVQLAVRTLCLLSMPFLIEGDGYTYFHLLEVPHSSLIHASGYCLSFWPATPVAWLLGVDTGEVLRIVQQLVSTAAVAVLYLGLRRVVRRWLAFAAAAILGTDAMLVVASNVSRPEFYEADLIMMLVALVLFALTSADVARKRRAYGWAGVVFGIAFVTKFNCLPCCALLAAPLADPALAPRERLRMAFRSGMLGLAAIVAFVVCFHWPTTRSHHLNLEHGWIHVQKLGLAEIPLLPANGLATRKYLTLVHALPPIGAGPDQWREIDAVSDAERAPFRARFGELMETRDEAVVDAALAPYRGVLRPAGDYHLPGTFARIYHHLGLVETEELLGAVYDEGRSALPGKYWGHVWRVVVDGLLYRGAYRPYLPMPSRRADFYALADRGLFDERASVVEAVDESLMKDADWAPAFWKVGAEWLEGWQWGPRCPEVVTWATIVIGLWCGLVLRRRGRGDCRVLGVLALTLAALLGMVAFSGLVFVFRQKELIATLPLIVIAAALGLHLVIEAMSVRFSREAPGGD